MRPVEDKNCYSCGVTQENGSTNHFHKSNGANKNSQNRKVLASCSKPTPSKWDDAQKWLVGLSGGGDQSSNKAKPRNSNADDRRLLNSASQKGRDSCSSADGVLYESVGMAITNPDEGEMKKIDCNESFCRTNKPMEGSPLSVRSICVRDMGTEMTPIASLEPSRTTTPIRATTPVSRSPISSKSSTPVRFHQGSQPNESYQTGMKNLERKSEAVVFGRGNGGGWPAKGDGEQDGCKIFEKNGLEQAKNPSSLESRAMAWDEAERTKYMARYKREEVKIQAWENHEKRKAEMELRRMEVKAERVKARAQERLTNKLAASRRIAEEKSANAEAKLNEKVVRTSHRADYIRRTGHLPSFFSFKLHSLCG